MRVSHRPAAVSAVFDDPDLVSCGGLVPVMALAERVGLPELIGERLTVAGSAGAHADAKVMSIVAGMVAGADSIDDLDLLRHGGMGVLFTGARAPSTLGTFLRAFRFGHVRQLDAVAARVTARLARVTPLLPGADQVAYVDVDDTVKRVHGYAKQGAGYGYTHVNGLNALLATVSTPLAAPVIVATRLRRGPVNSARGAKRLVADALRATARTGADPRAGSLVIVRADSAFYGYDTVAAARRAGARFSITARATPAVTRAIAGIPDDAWIPIHYPKAVPDPDTGELISDAEVAETTLTAFTARRRREHVTARLLVRRVRRLNTCTRTRRSAGEPVTQQDDQQDDQQGELFTTAVDHRYHAVFTDSPLGLIEAETAHRQHAVVEQVIADLKQGPLAHLPSGVFSANAAWLVLAALAHTLTRAAAVLAGGAHARARPASVRDQLISVPTRVARTARRLTLHLPRDWIHEPGWTRLFTAALHLTGPPRPAT
jgi:hypothetical protein